MAGGPATDRRRHGRRTRRPWRSSAGCARTEGSATTSIRRRPSALPPLVDFLVRTKLGYCQHFAGAMALMLRYLGIPARVAVGFTSGSWKDGVWTVTDHDAHAWVEAWFAGYGWLAFDPTPGRGRCRPPTRTRPIPRTLSGLSAAAGSSVPARRAHDAAASPGNGRYRHRRTARWLLPRRSSRAVGSLRGLAVAQGRRRRVRSHPRPSPPGGGRAAELAGFMRDQGAALSPERPSVTSARAPRGTASAATPSRAAFARAATGRRRTPRRPLRTRDASWCGFSRSCATGSARGGGSAGSSRSGRSAAVDAFGTIRV